MKATMRKYIGVVHKDAKSDYGVSFPDFPGAVAAASTLEEAVKMAAEALLLHVESMLAEGEAIPEPSTREQVLASAEYRGGKPIMVPLLTDAWMRAGAAQAVGRAGATDQRA